MAELHNPALQRDLRTIMSQAQRIMGLLDKMRVASHERLREMEATMTEEGIEPAENNAQAGGDAPR